MSLIPILLVIASLAGLFISNDFRNWVLRQVNAIRLLVQRYMPALLRIIGIYSIILLGATLFALLLITVALFINSPGFTAFAFVFALSLVLLAWMPAGIILRIFRVNSTVVPKALKTLIAYVAFVGFVGLVYPDAISYKSFFGVALIGFISIGLTAKINILDKVIFPLVIIMVLVVVWKHFSPDGFRSTMRYASSWSKQLNTSKDRSSIKHETNAATTYGVLIADINILYKGDSLIDTPINLKRGTIVKITNHKKEIKIVDGQGFIQIQLAKSNKSFLRGDKYWIEAEFVELASPRDITPESRGLVQGIGANSIIDDRRKDLSIAEKNNCKISVKDSVFTKGIYLIDVEGETPFRINVVSNKEDHRYALASLTGNEYHIIYNDGTDVSDRPGVTTVFPYQKNPKFLLRAGKATIRLVVS